MSYEGYEQYMCANGHFWEEPCSYDWGAREIIACPDLVGRDEDGKPITCNQPVVWHNSVDETNGDEYGIFLVKDLVNKEDAKWEECSSCGNKKLISDETFEVPTGPVQVYRQESHLDPGGSGTWVHNYIAIEKRDPRIKK